MRVLLWIFVLAVLGSTQVHVAQGLTKNQKEYQKKREELLVEAGARHLDLGLWLRDKGMVPQATREFIQAVEVSEGRHPGARTVLGVMRRYGEAFWKKTLKKPKGVLLKSYAKRVAKAERETQKEKLRLAAWAWRKKLSEEALGGYREILTECDAALEFDSKGRVIVAAGAFDAEVSAILREEAVAINERLYVRDAFLSLLPNVSSIYEAESDELRVRSMVSQVQAEELLRVGRAWIPVISENAGGRPTRRMNLFIFSTKEAFDDFLDAAQLSGHKAAAGVASQKRFVAVVDAGGRSAEEVRNIALHELAHLFMFGVTRGVMPSWYSEGFAETYGGDGSYVWANGELSLTGTFNASRLRALDSDTGFLPLRSLLEADATQLLATDKERAGHFYAESWAFVRFLEAGAGSEIAKRFQLWKTMCGGKGLGAEVGRLDSTNTTPARELFQQMFGPDLDDLEKRFRAYLAGL